MLYPSTSKSGGDPAPECARSSLASRASFFFSNLRLASSCSYARSLGVEARRTPSIGFDDVDDDLLTGDDDDEPSTFNERNRSTSLSCVETLMPFDFPVILLAGCTDGTDDDDDDDDDDAPPPFLPSDDPVRFFFFPAATMTASRLCRLDVSGISIVRFLYEFESRRTFPNVDDEKDGDDVDATIDIDVAAVDARMKVRNGARGVAHCRRLTFHFIDTRARHTSTTIGIDGNPPLRRCD